MKTVEEAWAEVEHQAGYTCDGYYGPVPVEDAARVLALATLEVATEYDTDHPVEQTHGKLWCCKYHMLRRAIEALGADDSP